MIKRQPQCGVTQKMFHAFCPFQIAFYSDELGFYYAVLISTRPEQILTKTKVTAVKVIQNITMWM